MLIALRFCLRLCQHVLTGHYSNINISISIRRMQGFHILMLVLMSCPSLLANKLIYITSEHWALVSCDPTACKFQLCNTNCSYVLPGHEMKVGFVYKFAVNFPFCLSDPLVIHVYPWLIFL